ALQHLYLASHLAARTRPLAYEWQNNGRHNKGNQQKRPSHATAHTSAISSDINSKDSKKLQKLAPSSVRMVSARNGFVSGARPNQHTTAAQPRKKLPATK